MSRKSRRGFGGMRKSVLTGRRIVSEVAQRDDGDWEVITVAKVVERPQRNARWRPEPVQLVDPLTQTRDELREIAKTRGVPGWHKMNKAALVTAIGGRT